MNPSPDRTKMAWVKLENLTSYSGDGDERQGIVSMEGWNPGDMHLHVENKKFGYSMKTNTGDANKRTDPVLNEWVNLAATYNSDTGKIALYVNGEEKVSEITETGLDVQPDDFIGAEFVGNDRNFNGSIDEVRVYNAALNEDQLDIAMYGPSNCFNDSKLIKPGDTYSCTTGVGIPDAGESISFTVSGPSDTKSWEYTCYGSATGDSCQ